MDGQRIWSARAGEAGLVLGHVAFSRLTDYFRFVFPEHAGDQLPGTYIGDYELK